MSARAKHNARKHSHGSKTAKARRKRRKPFCRGGKRTLVLRELRWVGARAVTLRREVGRRRQRHVVSVAEHPCAHATVTTTSQHRCLLAARWGILRKFACAGKHNTQRKRGIQRAEMSVPPGAAFCAETLSSKSCSSVSELRFELGLDELINPDDQTTTCDTMSQTMRWLGLSRDASCQGLRGKGESICEALLRRTVKLVPLPSEVARSLLRIALQCLQPLAKVHLLQQRFCRHSQAHAQSGWPSVASARRSDRDIVKTYI